MAWGAVLGGLLGAGGSVAGGLLGQARTPSPRGSAYNPNLDPAMMAAQFDALNQIGFGNISNVPSPYAQLVGRIDALTMPNKTRAQVISALNNLRSNPSDLEDPFGVNYSYNDLKSYRKNGPPSGRTLENGHLFDLGIASDKRAKPVKMPLKDIGALNRVLKGMGMTLDDLKTTFAKEAEYKAQVQRLEAAGLGKLNENTILNRASTANAASQLLGDAGRFATGSDPSQFQSGIMDRLNRNLDDQQTQMMLRAQYGGFNPSAGLEGIGRQRADVDMTALTQAVQAASALTAGLSGGQAVSQAAAGNSSQAALGALGIAAQQSMAANQLAQQQAINNSDSMANGISGGIGQLGNTLLFSSLMNQKPGTQTQRTPLYGTGTETGFRLNPNMLFGAAG